MPDAAPRQGSVLKETFSASAGALEREPILDAFEQMGVDEALLLESPPKTRLIRFYRWAGPAASFGYGQSLALARELSAARGASSWPLVRRPTGGGVVFHDGDITFSLVFPWEEVCDPSLIYERLHRGVLRGLESLGLRARLWSGPCHDAICGACFPEPSPLDLIDESGRKMLGGALRRSGALGLYQGSLRAMSDTPPGRPADEIMKAARAGLEAEWGGAFAAGIAPRLLEVGQRLAREKYRLDSWNARR